MWTGRLVSNDTQCIMRAVCFSCTMTWSSCFTPRICRTEPSLADWFPYRIYNSPDLSEIAKICFTFVAYRLFHLLFQDASHPAWRTRCYDASRFSTRTTHTQGNYETRYRRRKGVRRGRECQGTNHLNHRECGEEYRHWRRKSTWADLAIEASMDQKENKARQEAAFASTQCMCRNHLEHANNSFKTSRSRRRMAPNESNPAVKQPRIRKSTEVLRQKVLWAGLETKRKLSKGTDACARNQEPSKSRINLIMLVLAWNECTCCSGCTLLT